MTLTEFNKAVSMFGIASGITYRFTMVLENGIETAFAYTMPTADFNVLEGVRRHWTSDFVLVDGQVVKDRYLVFVPDHIRNMMDRLKDSAC